MNDSEGPDAGYAQLQRILASLSETKATMIRSVNAMLDRGSAVDELETRSDDVAASSEHFRLVMAPWYVRCWVRCRRRCRNNPFYWIFRCCRSAHRKPETHSSV